MSTYRLITPTDVLFLRGNRLFGGAGQHGASEMPPWPSVFAGAMASRILADQKKIDEITSHPDNAKEILAGAAGEDFACTFLGLLKDKSRVILPLPADLVAIETENDSLQLFSMVPKAVPKGLACSSALPLVPVLHTTERVKPVTGLWMDLDGWRRHLQGDLPEQRSLVPSSELWEMDHRLGIARDYKARTAAEGKIYTSEAVSLKSNATFLVGFNGENIPDCGLLRLGGDGRGAEISVPAKEVPPSDVGKPEKGWPGFRMILTSPGIFPNGWLPPGCKKAGDGIVLECGDLKAELRAAAIGRHEIISGWDMAKHCPKPARKVVPAGSVYWFRVEKGDTWELETLWREGLYASSDSLDDEYRVRRRREGFGRAWFGSWQPE